MAIRRRVLFGDPFLRKQCKEVRDFGSAKNRKIMRDLKDTLLHLQKVHGMGGGLAAPQIGYSKRLICIIAKGRAFFMSNPKITRKSKRMFSTWDFCFSEAAFFIAKVERHWKIYVEYHDESGQKRKEAVTGYFSELFQHEIDHLDGILFIDRLSNPGTIELMSEWKKRHKYSQS